jgi:hypothetical protein
MLCLRPLCGIVFGPVAMTAGGAAFLGTLAALALAACAAAAPVPQAAISQSKTQHDAK